MLVHQCPGCELRFKWKTELESHLREWHPDIQFDYPTTKPSANGADDADVVETSPSDPRVVDIDPAHGLQEIVETIRVPRRHRRS